MGDRPLGKTGHPSGVYNTYRIPFGSGALYQVTIAGRGLQDRGDWTSLSFLEGCMRAYLDGSAEPVLLSSGLEDDFLGTYYFNRGRYANDLAGLTHFDPKARTFSAYRFQDQDPLFFRSGLRLTCRCGETEDGVERRQDEGEPSRDGLLDLRLGLRMADGRG